MSFLRPANAPGWRGTPLKLGPYLHTVGLPVIFTIVIKSLTLIQTDVLGTQACPQPPVFIETNIHTKFQLLQQDEVFGLLLLSKYLYFDLHSKYILLHLHNILVHKLFLEELELVSLQLKLQFRL